MKFVDSPTERTTAATDLLLAAVGIGGALYLQGAVPEGSWKAQVWSWVFALVAFSGALGAVVHGIELPPGPHATLWQGINLGLGMSVSLFVVGVVCDLFGPAVSHRVLKVMLAAGVGFYLISRVLPGRFAVFVLYQAAASLFALAAYGWLVVGGHSEGAGFMALGVLAGLVAGWLQTRKMLTLRLGWTFDHNGLFHLVQAGALMLILFGLDASLKSY